MGRQVLTRYFTMGGSVRLSCAVSGRRAENRNQTGNESQKDEVKNGQGKQGLMTAKYTEYAKGGQEKEFAQLEETFRHSGTKVTKEGKIMRAKLWERDHLLRLYKKCSRR